MKYIKLFENFDAEREMSGILGYDVKLFNQVNKLIFLSPEQLQEWFYREMEKEQPNWDLIEVLQSQHGIEFDYKNLHWAAEHNNIGLAKYLLGKGADKDAQSKILLWTPLHYAAIYDSKAVAKLLIDARADKDAQTENLNTPLHYAALNDSEAVAKLLIDAGADKEAINKYLRTPLHYAAIKNSEAVAKLLIDAGADKGAKDNKGNIPWYYANNELRQSLPELNPDFKQFESENFDAKREMSGILGYDVKLFHQVNKLLFLRPEELQDWFEEEMGKEQPNWNLIEILQSQHGIEFDYKDLDWAAGENKVGLAKYWLDKGADKDAQNWNSRTPLHFAAINDSGAVAKLLIDAGADKEAKDKVLQTPLHYAAIYDSEAVAKLLIDAGANKDAQNKNLQTPLHLAASFNRKAVAKLLIDAGADKGAKDKRDNRPWDYANDKLRQSLPELNPDVKQFESENFDAERNMSDFLGYDVKLFHQVNKLLFLSQEELQEWFEDEMEKEEPRWDLIEILETQHGIEFDYKNLHWAAEHDSVGLAKYWLDKGVDMDALDEDDQPVTPLHLAASFNRKAVAKLLIDAGADKDAQTDKFETPLHFAASFNRKAVAKLLIDAGADKGAKDKRDNRPWDYANNELRQSLPELNPNI